MLQLHISYAIQDTIQLQFLFWDILLQASFLRLSAEKEFFNVTTLTLTKCAKYVICYFFFLIFKIVDVPIHTY